MNAIEFQTTVKKIISAIPKDKRGELGAQSGDATVRVIVLTTPHQKPGRQKNLLQDAKEKGYEDFLEYLFDHPLEKAHLIRFTREQLHERDLTAAPC